MSEESSPTEDWSKRFVEYMSSASTRSGIYDRMAEELGVSRGNIKNIASKAGLTPSPHSLSHLFLKQKKTPLLLFVFYVCVKGSHLLSQHSLIWLVFLRGEMKSTIFHVILSITLLIGTRMISFWKQERSPLQREVWKQCFKRQKSFLVSFNSM